MTDLPSPAFRTVVLDVDSTVSGIEGIDWLAARRGDIVSRRVADLTNTAMQGGIPLEQVYGLRLDAIRPRREEVDALSRAYVDALAPGALETIGRLKNAGVQIVLVSGGLRHALLRLALHLGLSATDVHAVSLRFDAVGAYQGYDTGSPMTTSDGKRRMVESLALDGPILAVGDGATDLAMRDVVDLFVAVHRISSRAPNVVDRADVVVGSFARARARCVVVSHSATLPIREPAHAPNPSQQTVAGSSARRDLARQDRSDPRAAARAQAKGARVIRFESGDPSFSVAPHVLTAIADAGAAGKTHYVPNDGIPELRRALADKLVAKNGIADITAERRLPHERRDARAVRRRSARCSRRATR